LRNPASLRVESRRAAVATQFLGRDPRKSLDLGVDPRASVDRLGRGGDLEAEVLRAGDVE
jgi:hypothetical protein